MHDVMRAVKLCVKLQYSKINVTHKILIESRRKEKRQGSKKPLNEFPSKGWSRNELDILLRRTDARGSADRKVAWGLLYSYCANTFAVVEHSDFDRCVYCILKEPNQGDVRGSHGRLVSRRIWKDLVCPGRMHNLGGGER